MLRGLALEEVVDELPDGRFALTPIGESLRALQGPIIVRGELYYAAAAGLLDAVRDGGVPFERVHGERFFEYLGHHADEEAAFHASMTARAHREADDVVAAYDFSAARHLVDVGGGNGVLLAAILRAAPELRAILLDRPAALVARAPAAVSVLEAARAD